MLSAWSAEGLPPNQFWRVTPRVFTAIMEGRRQARDRDDDRALFTAWHVEMFAREKRLKGLDQYLAKARRARTSEELANQTPEDMLAVLQSFKAGGADMQFRFIPHGAAEEA